MRRASIGILLLMLLPAITQAWYDIPLECRVHFSPYAFSYHSNGLVPGGFKYNPYAFSRSTTGIVFKGFRYNPYAFNYTDTGLILDYYYWWPFPWPQAVAYSSGNTPGSYNGNVQPGSSAPPSYSFSVTVPERAPARPAQPEQNRHDDPLIVIKQHLRDRGFTNVSINRILRVDGKLLSADFLLQDQNLLIKYWDLRQIEALDAKADLKQKMVEKYRKDWEAYAEQYKQSGGKIYTIEVSDREEIKLVLDSCSELTPGNGTASAQTLYARQ
jgi:hypothetical protein